MDHQHSSTFRKFGLSPKAFVLLTLMIGLLGTWKIANALATAGHPSKTETAAWVYQVKDINTQFPLSWSWDSSAIVGNNLYFGIDSSNPAGVGLWKSDGSSAGTVRVYLGYEPREITAAGQSLFFESYDPATLDSLLLVSDGTQAGTRVLKRWSITNGCTPVDLKFINNLLFFQCGPAVHQLWISDGTITGTVILSGFQSLDRMLAIGDTLYMAASKTSSRDQLWESDGTLAGTQLVKDLQPGSVDTLVNVNGLLYFSAYNGVDGYALWKSDGTPGGTTKIKDFLLPAFQDIPANLTDVNGILFFSIWEDTGCGLWKSDGTEAGTVKVKDIFYIPDSELGHVNSTLFFAADDGVHGNELWKSDGTLTGTVMVKDINPGSGFSNPYFFTNVAGTLFYIAENREFNWELWKTDGTGAGTGLVKDILPGTGSSQLTGLIDFSGTLFFFADSGSGLAFWQSHGTQATTTPVKLLSPVGGSSSPTGLVDMNGQAYFAADDGIHGSELWKSNGSVFGTMLVSDIYSGSNSALADPESGLPSFQAASVGNSLFFIANDGLHGSELWKTEGTSSGTSLVKDIRPGPLGASYADLTGFNGELFFVSGMDKLDTLWKSDGTFTDTVLITQVSGSYGIRYLTPISDTLYFIASDPGVGLWKSDGTLMGTLLVKNGFIISGTDTGPANLTDVGGTLFLSADDGVDGNELWESNGTPAGTVMVKDITPGSSGSTLDSFLDVNGILYFTSRTGAGTSLWKSDGSEAGTVKVKDFVSILSDRISYQNKIYFNADDGIHGDELWQSEGTEAGTSMVKDINPIGSSDPRLFIVLGGTMYFTADDGTYGRELWQSDGTTESTLRAADIDIGPDSSNPAWLTDAGGLLLFAADDGQTGTELWALNPDILRWDIYLPIIIR